MRGTKKSFKDKPLVTVVTVVLNDKENVAKTIKSVLQQEYDNIEYVLIDGGSTDGTLEVVKNYNDQIDYWMSEPDKGIGVAFNKGIRLLSGELIGILNAGDWYEPDTIFRVVEAYKTETDADVFCGAAQYWGAGGKGVFCYSNPNLLEKETSVYHPTVFVNRKAYERYGLFDEHFRFAMDYELLLRFKMNGAKFKNIPHMIANLNLDGRSTRFWLDGLKEVQTVRKKYFPVYNVLFYHYLAIIKNVLAYGLKGIGFKGLYEEYWRMRNARTLRNL